jgi:membrane-associated phospholipid phosphatase
MERRIFLKFGTGAAIGAALTACGSGGGGGGVPSTPPPEPVRTQVVLGWNNVALDAVRATRAAPPIAARALAIVHTAMYNAWAAYDPIAANTIAGIVLRRPADEHTPANALKAYSFAAYAALVDQFPTQKAAFDAHMARLGFHPAHASPDFTLPHGVGSIAARTVLERAHADGANQLGDLTPSGIPFADYLNYTPVNAPLAIFEPTARSAIADPGHWQPLRFRDSAGAVRTQVFTTPFWGKVRPFALTSGAQFRPAAPAAYGSAAFAAQAQHMVATQIALTETHKVMVEYWAGGATGELPSTYWSQFAQFISRRDSHSEADDIKLFFALANAVFDAGIAAWDAKLAYNSARPITAVRYLLAGQRIEGYGAGPAGGLQAIAGEAWLPYQPLSSPGPAHPDYVSGHSTYSAASAAVLRLFTGSDVFKHSVTIAARSMLFDPALPAADATLSWDTFTYAACEAGTSRVYGGIHFPDADVAGRALGEQVGAAAFQKARCYWLGQA